MKERLHEVGRQWKKASSPEEEEGGRCRATRLNSCTLPTLGVKYRQTDKDLWGPSLSVLWPARFSSFLNLLYRWRSSGGAEAEEEEEEDIVPQPGGLTSYTPSQLPYLWSVSHHRHQLVQQSYQPTLVNSEKTVCAYCI